MKFTYTAAGTDNSVVHGPGVSPRTSDVFRANSVEYLNFTVAKKTISQVQMDN